MAVDIETLGIPEMTVLERLYLIEQIWESLPEQVDPSEVPEWHREELAKRLANVDADPSAGRPWREVIRELKDDA